MDGEHEQHQEPPQSPPEAAEFIGPRLEDRLPPEVMRRLVFVEDLRDFVENTLFFVPNSRLKNIEAKVLDLNTPDEERMRLLVEWEDESQAMISGILNDPATETGRQFAKASIWLALGDEERTREHLNWAFAAASGYQYEYVREAVNEMIDAYRSGAFEIPEN